MDPICCHCGKRKANLRRRGLCWTCHQSASIRKSQPSHKFAPKGEPTQKELDAIIAEQMANLPKWWAREERRMAMFRTEEERDEGIYQACGSYQNPQATDKTLKGVTMPIISGDLNVYRTLDGQPTGVVVKGSPALLGGWCISNAASSARYVKLYDLAGTPHASDTPTITIGVPQTSADPISFSAGVKFFNGLGIRVTTGVADSDTVAPTSNDVQVNLFYQ